MDIRKIKKLIELVEESGISELEISEGEESVRISRELEELMSTRGQYAADSCTLPVVDTDERYAVAVAAPILSEGDVLGCVLFVAGHGDGPAGETERKLAQAVSGFLGKQMES